MCDEISHQHQSSVSHHHYCSDGGQHWAATVVHDIKNKYFAKLKVNPYKHCCRIFNRLTSSFPGPSLSNTLILLLPLLLLIMPFYSCCDLQIAKKVQSNINTITGCN